MAFPATPPTSDAKRSELLRLFAVDGYPNVYILGSHARYVTVYGQQVRALNLVAALVKSGYISRSTRVGVIGGGIAGLTAAAAAAEAEAGLVHVFESEPSLMRFQRNSEKRFIHPRIYDWPDPEVRASADLPIMSWEAGTASNVAKHLLTEFEKLREKAGDRFPRPLTGCHTFELKSGPTPTLVVDGRTYELDVLILAVGFGRDDTPWTLGYWTDDDLGATELEQAPRTWLISGSGDGALTDLMRLCILDFTHEAVLEAVDNVTRDRVGARLFAVEKDQNPPGGRTQEFLAAAKEVDADLRARLQFRNVGTVYLNCDPDTLFERGSSVLNRLITAWLLINDRFTPIAGGRMSDPIQQGDRLRIDFEKREPLQVDRVVLRHGPKTPYEKEAWLQPLGRATSGKREDWKATRQFDDWTRTPMWNDELELEALPKALRIDFGNRIGCVIVTGAHEFEGRRIALRITDVLQRLEGKRGTKIYGPGREIDKTPVVLSMGEALSSTVMYERAVRAMCTAEIAIFDLTDHESTVMLLLGIRSAVRRGVTVAVTAKPGERAPFNIGSLNPVPFNHGTYLNDQTAALDSAFETLMAIPYDYLDLPAYDAVRTLGDDYRERAPKEEVLVLRWFDPEYSRLVGDEVIRGLLETRWPNTKVLTTLDSRSPQLVEQRLYAAMRRDLLCVADWTAARPSVFFELGVRLAVSEHDPISILCSNPPAAGDFERGWPKDDPWLPQLEAMFGVTRFTMEDDKPLRERIENYKAPSGGKLSRGRTYAVITEAIDAAREPGGEPVETWLLRTASQISGPPVEDGMVPVLYADKLLQQARRAAAERMLAAWYYLSGRHRVLDRMKAKEIAPDDPLLLTMIDVATKFSAQARDSGEEFQALAKEVRQALLEISVYMKGKPDGGRDQ